MLGGMEAPSPMRAPGIRSATGGTVPASDVAAGALLVTPERQAEEAAGRLAAGLAARGAAQEPALESPGALPPVPPPPAPAAMQAPAVTPARAAEEDIQGTTDGLIQLVLTGEVGKADALLREMELNPHRKQPKDLVPNVIRRLNKIRQEDEDRGRADAASILLDTFTEWARKVTRETSELPRVPTIPASKIKALLASQKRRKGILPGEPEPGDEWTEEEMMAGEKERLRVGQTPEVQERDSAALRARYAEINRAGRYVADAYAEVIRSPDSLPAEKRYKAAREIYLRLRGGDPAMEDVEAPRYEDIFRRD